MIPFILLGAGLLLIFLEFYLPGGIMGTLGGVVVLASIVSFAITYDSPVLILLYSIGTVALLFLLFKYALWRIKSAKPENSVYSEGSQEGYVASEYDRLLVGKKGVVATDMRPGGKVIIEGKKYTAISTSGYLPKGQDIVVTGGQGETLTVKLQKKDDNDEKPASH